MMCFHEVTRQICNRCNESDKPRSLGYSEKIINSRGNTRQTSHSVFVSTQDVRTTQPSTSSPPPPSFRRSAASNTAVTFNSRAQRRPICVVRTSITPDKTRVIYLLSTRDAITRLLTFPSFASVGKKQEEKTRNKKKCTNNFFQ